MAISVTGLTVHTQTGGGTWKDYGGGGGSAANTDVFISSTGSRGRKVSNAVRGFAYEVNATGTDLSSSIIVIRWATLAGVGALASIAGDGVRMVLEDTSGNISYWTLAGNDTYTGGWEVSVIDTSLSATANNGTAATLTAIRYVGIEWNETATVGGGDPNCFIDEILSMPNTGLTVTGNSTSLISDLQAWDDASDYGIFEQKGGIYFCKVPLILSPDVSDFISTDETLIFEDKFYEDGTNISSAISTIGLSSADADVIQFNRCSIIAETNGDVNGTASDKEIDFSSATGIDCNIVTFSGWKSSTSFNSIQLGATGNTYDNVSFIGNDSMTHTSGATLANCSFINALTADGEAYLTTNNPANISDSSFTFSDGHAIRITATGTFNLDNIVLNNYLGTGTNDAAFFNDSGGAVTLNILNGGTSGTYRNGTGATTTVDQSVTITLSGLIANSRVYIRDTTNSITLFNEIETTTTFSDTYSYAGDINITIRVRNASGGTRYKPFETTGVVTGQGFSLIVNQELDE